MGSSTSPFFSKRIFFPKLTPPFHSHLWVYKTRQCLICTLIWISEQVTIDFHLPSQHHRGELSHADSCSQWVDSCPARAARAWCWWSSPIATSNPSAPHLPKVGWTDGHHAAVRLASGLPSRNAASMAKALTITPIIMFLIVWDLNH